MSTPPSHGTWSSVGSHRPGTEVLQRFPTAASMGSRGGGTHPAVGGCDDRGGNVGLTFRSLLPLDLETQLSFTVLALLLMP